MTKAYFKKKQVDFKLVVIKHSLIKAYPYRGDRKSVFKVYESNIFKNIRLGLKFNHNKFFSKQNLKPNFNILDLPKFSKALSFKKNSNNPEKASFLKYIFRKLKKTKISCSYFMFKKKNFKKFNKDFLFDRKNKKVSKLKYVEKNRLTKFNRRFLSRKGYSNSKLSLECSSTFSSESEKTLLESFRFDPVYMRNNYSLFSGPRKRLSRNLRRAFKGKHIKIVADMI